MRISLVVATLKRYEELDEMIHSIVNQKYDLSQIEIIIIDQNDIGLLNPIIEKYKFLNIKYIHSKEKGLSLNRNKGLKYVEGDIICFPDDDCKFYDDTLLNVISSFSNPNIDFCLGRIYDKNINQDIIRKWPKKSFKINKFNSYFINSSITLFIKRQFILDFDENLGIGSKYGSCEDADFLYRILKNGAKGIYRPEIQLWHPQVNFTIISLDKVKNYASGFGYFIRKEMDIIKIVLLILLVIKKIIQFFLNLINKNFKKNYFIYFFEGLLIGLMKSNKDKLIK